MYKKYGKLTSWTPHQSALRDLGRYPRQSSRELVVKKKKKVWDMWGHEEILAFHREGDLRETSSWESRQGVLEDTSVLHCVVVSMLQSRVWQHRGDACLPLPPHPDSSSTAYNTVQNWRGACIWQGKCLSRAAEWLWALMLVVGMLWNFWTRDRQQERSLQGSRTECHSWLDDEIASANKSR